jgi:hypothetical protein
MFSQRHTEIGFLVQSYEQLNYSAKAVIFCKRKWRVALMTNYVPVSWHSNFHFCVYKTAMPMPILSLLIRVDAVTVCIPKIPLNVIHPYTRTPLRPCLPFRCSNKYLRRFSSFSACNTRLASCLLLFKHNVIWFREQIKKQPVKGVWPVFYCSSTENSLHEPQINFTLPRIPTVQKTRLYYILIWSLNLFLSVCGSWACRNTYCEKLKMSV